MLFFAVSAVAVAAYTRSRAGGSGRLARRRSRRHRRGLRDPDRRRCARSRRRARLSHRPRTRRRRSRGGDRGDRGSQAVSRTTSTSSSAAGADEPLRARLARAVLAPPLVGGGGCQRADLVLAELGLRALPAATGAALLAVVGWALWSRRRTLGPVDGFVAATTASSCSSRPSTRASSCPSFYLVGYCVLPQRGGCRRWRRSARQASSRSGWRASGTRRSSPTPATASRPVRGRQPRPHVPHRLGSARPGDANRVEERILWALRRYDPDPPSFP